MSDDENDKLLPLGGAGGSGGARGAGATAADNSSDSDSSSDSGSSSSSDSDSSSGSGSSSDSDSSSSSSSSSGSDSDAGSDAPKRLGKRKAGAKTKPKRPLARKKPAKRRKVDSDDEAEQKRRPKRAPRAKGEGSGGTGGQVKGAGAGAGAEDGGEYSSEGEVERTADDDAFIDADDDDQDLLREYANDVQEFDDERPRGGSGKRKRASGSGGGSGSGKRGAVDSEDISGEKRAGKGRVVKEMSDEAKRAIVRNLLSQMFAAARQDVADRAAGKPAARKLSMLPAVRTAVANTTLHEFLLEGTVLGTGAQGAYDTLTVLQAFKEWLRPLPGSELPFPQLREAVYDMLNRLPITLDHLRESKIGVILYALAEHPKESDANRALLKGMIERFSRAIFHKTANYKNREAVEGMLAAQESLGLVTLARSNSASSAPSTDAAGEVDLEGGAGGGAGAGAAAAANLDALLGTDAGAAAAAEAGGFRHARVPKPLVFDYVRRPVSGHVAAAEKREMSGGGADLSKRLKELKRTQAKKVERGAKISIEGRNMF